MDRALHAARIDPATRKGRRFLARMSELPDGVFVLGRDDRPALLWKGELHPYLGDGYGDPTRAEPDRQVLVLTPAPSVAALEGGYAVSVRLPAANA
jgi:hypothetical protein